MEKGCPVIPPAGIPGRQVYGNASTSSAAYFTFFVRFALIGLENKLANPLAILAAISYTTH
jgi:hypothetical protein